MEDLHEKLMREFRIYFTNYQQFAVERTMASARRCRINLENIKQLTYQMKKELLHSYKFRQRRASENYKPRGQPQKPKEPDQESAT
jgi:hypothetical protein